MLTFIRLSSPATAICCGQNANLIVPSSGRHAQGRSRLGELNGLSGADCCGGGTCIGIAATSPHNEIADEKRRSHRELPVSDLCVDQVTIHSDTMTPIATGHVRSRCDGWGHRHGATGQTVLRQAVTGHVV